MGLWAQAGTLNCLRDKWDLKGPALYIPIW